uniref:Mediator of RNA polymerase II transcription subunit 1 n=1 Tax=Steinernema glaseri TaxID=37863 RepID=A0A1I7ZX11_9BILA
MYGLLKKEPMDVDEDPNEVEDDPLQMFSMAQVDSASRIDTVRNKNPATLDFDTISKNLRKNMMDKKIVLETDARGHLLNSMKTLRKSFLGDGNVDFQSHLKMLADVLNCQLVSQTCYHELKRPELVMVLRMDGPSNIGICNISWFQEKTQSCDVVKKLLEENKWGELESGLSKMLQIIPSRFAPNEMEICLRALSVTERDLLFINSSADTTLTPMECVNQLPLGLCQPRTALTPFTIYLLADPILFRAAKDSSPDDVLKRLPNAILTISESSSVNVLPDTSNVDPRTRTWLQKQEGMSGRPIRAALCLKLSSPILLFSQMVSNLASVGAELVFSPNGTSVNYFHTILGTTSTTLYSRLSENFAIRFSLEPTMSVMALQDQAASIITEIRVSDPRQIPLVDQAASIITEIRVSDPRQIPLVVQLLRQQLVFNSLMEGISRSCSPLSSLAARPGNPKVVKDVRLGISLESSMIEMDFQHNKKIAVARVNVASHGMGIMIEFMDQTPFDEQALFGAQRLMNLTWSLPLVMHGVLSSDSKVVDYDQLVKSVVERGQAIVKASSKDFGVSFSDKVGDAWLCIFKNRKRKRTEDAVVPKVNELVVELDDSLVPPGGMSFLASFKELDPEEKLLCPPPPPRTSFGIDMSTPASLRVPDLSSARSRLSTDGMALNNALSDLDALAEMGNDDTDSVMSENSGRSSTVERCSPAGFKNGVTPQSPSELQRQRMALQQSMGVQATGPTSSVMAQMDLRMKLMQQSQQQMRQLTPPSAASSDVFDFAASEDSNSGVQAGSTPSSGTSTPFTAGSASNPFQFPSPNLLGNARYGGRGMANQAPKRGRGRARKGANLGDRQASLDSLGSSVLEGVGGSLSAQLPASGAGSRGGKQRGAVAQRRPRKPRRGSVSATGPTSHQFPPFMGAPGQMQRPFPDLSQSSLPPQLRSSEPSLSTSTELDYEEESSDGETDPPPPPKSALPPTLPPAVSSAPVLTPSVTPPIPRTAPPATSFSALLTERSNSSSPLVSAESVQIQKIINEESISSKPSSPSFSKGRKSSLESIISKTPSVPIPVSRLNASDLYDDGTQSRRLNASDLYDDGTQSRSPSPQPVVLKRESPRPASATDSGSSGGKIVLKLPKQTPLKKTETLRMSAGQPPSSRVGKDSVPSRSKHPSSRSSKEKEEKESSKARKSSKRKGTDGSSSSNSSKKPRSSGSTATASPTTVPNALPFGFTNTALPKSFKIPKVNDPPESSKEKEEKESSKARKSSKRKGTDGSSSSSSSKKPRSSGSTATASPTTVPNALPFGFTNTALPKSFKIPKVNDPPESAPTLSSSASSSKLNAPSQHATGSNTIPLHASQAARPKSILKSGPSLEQPSFSPLGFPPPAGGSGGRRTLLPAPGAPVPIPIQPTRTSVHPPAPILQPKRPSVPQFPQSQPQFFGSAPQLQRYSTPSTQQSDDMDFSRDSPGGEEGGLRIVDDAE